MTTYIASTVISSGDAPFYWLAVGDGLIVTATGALFATDDAPIFLDTDNYVRVDGGVYADNGGSAIFEGGLGGGGGSRLEVGAGGVIQSQNEGVLLNFDGNRIENHGEITAGRAIVAPSIDLINGGLIAGAQTGVELTGLAASNILNTGIIRGAAAVTAGGGADVVENAGLIIGDVDLGAGDDRYLGRLGTVTTWVSGGAGNDGLSGGGAPDDLRGGDDNDRVAGGGGDDTLWGGKGKDLLAGGGGDDLLIGGVKADVFQFGRGFGHDTIADFAATGVRQDTIQFSRAVFETFAEVSAASEQVGADVIIHAGGHDLLLRNVSLADLDGGDFGFVA